MKKTIKSTQVKLTKNGKRMGRPPKVVVENNNLRDAIAVMMDLVAKHKDLFVSFDSKRKLVEFMWQDEVYQVAPQEVDQILSAMKYLEGKKLAWTAE